VNNTISLRDLNMAMQLGTLGEQVELLSERSFGHFNYKAHIGVDKESGLVHTVKVTVANEYGVTVISELLAGDEKEVYGDSV